jgi:hypothetical protein
MLLDLIKGWQEKAKQIAPPEGTGILPARGGLPGAAFFPEGLGLQTPTANADSPWIIAIGHNFGCVAYRDSINDRGHEDDKTTWRNLRTLLEHSGMSIESCFMTNWFVGLLPSNKQVGNFLTFPNERYQRECRELLLDQIRRLKPRLILLLGLPVVSRAHEVMPTLRPWAGAKSWRYVDGSKLGSIAKDIEVVETGVRANVVPLLHPSFAPPNQRFRAGKFPMPGPEVEMLKKAAAHILCRQQQREE